MGGRPRILVVATLAFAGGGCQQLLGFESPTLGGDAGAKDSLDDASTCFGSGAYVVCLQVLPQGPFTFTNNQVVDTAPGSMACSAGAMWSIPNQPDSCFVVATAIELPSILVHGSRPLVLVATDAISVTGTLDAASHVANGLIGPAAPAATCLAGTLPQNGTNGAGGGAGGSYVLRGGDGGSGNAGANNGGLSANAVAMPGTLQAGCNGQTGGQGSSFPPSPGRGGGAVALIAGHQIVLNQGAILNVSGSGGHTGGAGDGGGGGGGSGGMLVLNAPSIVDSPGSIVIANGGGGGGGGGGATGSDGGDPDPKKPTSVAPGGGSTCGNNNGGFGGINATAPHVGANGGNGCAGGGGGGAVGYIQANQPLSAAMASPAVNVVQP